MRSELRAEENEPIMPPVKLSELPTEQPEFQVIFDAAKEKTTEITETVTAETDGLLAEREDRLAAIKKEAGPDDIEKLRELEEKIRPLQLKLQKMKRIFKRMAPFIIPLVFAAKLTRSELLSNEGTFDKRTVAAEQLKRDGITDERKAAYTPGVSELLFHGITPVGYQDIWQAVKSIPENVLRGREVVKVTIPDAAIDVEIIRKSVSPEREDAWRFYLGLPQEHNTFSISEFKPEKSKENQYYYRINNWLEKFIHKMDIDFGNNSARAIHAIVRACEGEFQEHHAILEELNTLEILRDKLYERKDKSRKKFIKEHHIYHESDWTEKLETEWDQLTDREDKEIKQINERLGAIWKRRSKLVETAWISEGGSGYVIATDSRPSIDKEAISYGVMGRFKISLGEDGKGKYFSYYDQWDLGGNKVEGEKGLLGKPFEIYDRIYYDPVTFEVIK